VVCCLAAYDLQVAADGGAIVQVTGHRSQVTGHRSQVTGQNKKITCEFAVSLVYILYSSLLT